MVVLIVVFQHFTRLLQTINQDLQLFVQNRPVVLNRVHRREAVRVDRFLANVDDVNVLQLAVFEKNTDVLNNVFLLLLSVFKTKEVVHYGS